MPRHRAPRRLARVPLFVGLVALAFAVTGCGMFRTTGTLHRIGSEPYTKGSGHVTSVDRPLGSFHAISVDNGLTVLLSHGVSDTAKVSADDNLTGMIKTEVSDGVLRVWVEGSLETRDELMVDVKAASPVDIWSVNGGSTLDSEDAAIAAGLRVTVTSGSTVRGGGRAGALDLHVSTGSTGDLQNLTVATATVTVDTGSTGFVRATDSVGGACTMGSTLHVLGKPATRSVTNDTSSTVSFE